MTQKQQIASCIAQIERHLALRAGASDPLEGLIELNDKLGSALDDAASAPPLGKADGSVGPREWGAAGRVKNNLFYLLEALRDWTSYL